ncbi:hypothetical protein ACSV9I_07865 [Rhizobium sp. G187]|uniref:hypothetical protein n=1 Tax=Rhizobium sp. G187 TaxID=3451352 RepID=UPI003EE56A5F
MTTESVSLDFLARQAKTRIDEMRPMRKDLGDVLRLVNGVYDLTRRPERRQVELRDDLELTIKMELGGALGNIQTSLEATLARIETSVADLGHRVSDLEHKP